jgi:DNA-binding LytR/AlgR family response regulator
LTDPHQFFRTSRNRLLSFQSIDKIFSHFNGRLKLDLIPADNEEVFVSRERVSNFKEWLDR